MAPDGIDDTEGCGNAYAVERSQRRVRRGRNEGEARVHSLRVARLVTRDTALDTKQCFRVGPCTAQVIKPLRLYDAQIFNIQLCCSI